MKILLIRSLVLQSDIFAAHHLILEDPEWVKPIKDKIAFNQINAEFALKEVTTMFVSMFEGMDNPYMKERASDIKDVSKRVLARSFRSIHPYS